MEATTALLDGCASIFSQCEMCTKREQLKIGVLIISFILGTVDMVTDWINWIQWRSVGGYDQHYFVYIITTTFLCAATMGTVLWTIEIFLLFHRSWKFIQRHGNQSNTKVRGSNQESQHNAWSDRLEMIVRLLIGLLEDLPVVILLYYSAVIAFCGVPVYRDKVTFTKKRGK